MSVQFSNFKTLDDYMAELGRAARTAQNVLRTSSSEVRNQAIRNMAKNIRANSAAIVTANEKDMAAGRDKGLSPAMLDRLRLDAARIDGIADGLDAIAALPDPVGQIDESWSENNGLSFEKVRVPIGIIGMIYESRPNVTADAGALAVKSGNGCILRGGSEAMHSNLAIYSAMRTGLAAAGLHAACVQYIDTTDRAAVGALLGGIDGAVDMIIPRGGKGLIARVQKDARVPVLAHLEGLNHSYVHKSADLEKAERLVLNAKLRRTGVCGSTETLLIDREIADVAVPKLLHALTEGDCEIRGDADVCALFSTAKLASETDFQTEHLAAIINVRLVDRLEDALTHIATYGSGHTDCIICEDADAAARFLREVDSAICMHNTSTQFADGGEFGFGAEIGIATGRLHARGPVGAKHLTTFKYRVTSNGQTRS